MKSLLVTSLVCGGLVAAQAVAQTPTGDTRDGATREGSTAQGGASRDDNMTRSGTNRSGGTGDNATRGTANRGNTTGNNTMQDGANRDALARGNATTGDKMSGTMTDANFVKELAAGGMKEVEAGKIASERATHADVKKFAQQMVTDHTRNNEKLKNIARERQIDLPTKLDAAHTADKTKLESQRGANFDAAYMDSQVRDHEKTVQLLTRQINSGQDAKLKAFAQETLPVVQHHLEMAKDLQKKAREKSAQGR